MAAAPLRRRWPRRVVKMSLGTGALGALALAADHAAKAGDHRLDWVSSGVRLGRCCSYAAVITADYKWTLATAPAQQGRERQRQLDSAHERNALRLRALLFANRGIYIKLGQHMGLLDYLLPPQYVTTMRGCFDNAPASPWSAVRGTFRRELGALPDELFAEFDREPIASASLAQVHVATLRDGRRVAVKVQHPGLHSMARSEIALLEQLLAVVHWALPQADLQWLIDEVKFNLPRELDFRHEAQNAARARAQLRRFGDAVVVPGVLHELSTDRILTMDYEPGCQVADREAIEELGLNPRDVARSMSELFCEMVFVHGFVHCDPHPGNVLVRAWKTGQPQLVLLDHGLYRDVEESTRLHYCALWKGIVLADEDAIITASKGLGVYSPMMEKLYPDRKGGVSHTLLAAMLTQKGWNHVIDPDMSSLELPPPKSEAEKQAETVALDCEDEDRVVAAVANKRLDEISSAATAAGENTLALNAGGAEAGSVAMASSAEAAEAYEAELRTNVAEYLPGIMEVLQSVDRSVLLLLKTNDCLRSANVRLGGRATETYIVTAEYCIRALGEGE